MIAPSLHPVFTIGHSNHEGPAFLALLQQHQIAAVADVRSSPYSRFAPQFNRDKLKAMLEQTGLRYAHLGAELGARRSEPEVYKGPVASYERIATCSQFSAGLDRVEEGAKRMRLAMMCSEKDPITCHRCVLVARHLIKRGLTVMHILEDGRLETQAESETRLLKLLDLPDHDLFHGRDFFVDEAYLRQGEKIAYRRDLDSEGVAA